MVHELFSGKSPDESFVTSYLAVLEMNTVAARYLRGRLLRSGQYQNLRNRMTRDFSDYGIVSMPLDNHLAEEAQQLLPAYPLRAADALHFATVRRVGVLIGDQPYFVLSADRDFNDVCGAYRLSVLDPNDPNALGDLRSLR